MPQIQMNIRTQSFPLQECTIAIHVIQFIVSAFDVGMDELVPLLINGNTGDQAQILLKVYRRLFLSYC